MLLPTRVLPTRAQDDARAHPILGHRVERARYWWVAFGEPGQCQLQVLPGQEGRGGWQLREEDRRLFFVEPLQPLLDAVVAGLDLLIAEHDRLRPMLRNERRSSHRRRGLLRRQNAAKNVQPCAEDLIRDTADTVQCQNFNVKNGAVDTAHAKQNTHVKNASECRSGRHRLELVESASDLGGQARTLLDILPVVPLQEVQPRQEVLGVALRMGARRRHEAKTTKKTLEKMRLRTEKAP